MKGGSIRERDWSFLMFFVFLFLLLPGNSATAPHTRGGLNGERETETETQRETESGRVVNLVSR